MKKKIFVLFILAAILILPTSAFAAEDNTKIAAYPGGDNIVFDGSKIVLKTYNIKDENYVKLRDVASLLKGTKAQFAVIWDEESMSVIITQGQGHDEDFKNAVLDPNEAVKEGQVTSHKILKSDKTPLNLKGYLVAGNNYFRLRDLGKELGFGVAYDFVNNNVILDSTNPDLKDIIKEKVKVDAKEELARLEKILANLEKVINDKGLDTLAKVEDAKRLIDLAKASIEGEQFKNPEAQREAFLRLEDLLNKINQSGAKLGLEKHELNLEKPKTPSPNPGYQENPGTVKPEPKPQPEEKPSTKAEKVSIAIYGRDNCGNCRGLKAYLDRKNIPYTFSSIDNLPQRARNQVKGDTIYLPATIISTTIDGRTVERYEFSYSQSQYDSIFAAIENNTYFK